MLAGIRRIAIDANLMMRHSVRRYFCGAMEVRGGEMILPARAWREAIERYRKRSWEYGKGRSRFLARERWGAKLTGEQEAEREDWTKRIAKGANDAFQQWMRAETARNGAAWRVEGRDPRAVELANDLVASDAFRGARGEDNPADACSVRTTKKGWFIHTKAHKPRWPTRSHYVGRGHGRRSESLLEGKIGVGSIHAG